MRIDHVTIQGKLHGVWQALGGGVFDFKEMNRRFAHVCPKFLGYGRKYEKYQIYRECEPRYSRP